MFKIFQIFIYSLILIQHAQGQTKKRQLKQSSNSKVAEVVATKNTFRTAAISKSLGKSRKKKSNLVKLKKMTLEVMANNLPKTLQIKVATLGNDPFVVYLIDQNQRVYFRQHYLDTQKVNILIYFKYPEKGAEYQLHIISPSQHIQRKILAAKTVD
ncbi:MAG TPA: hypothetical protein DCS93_01495 [Microscillaceae bacterium]|nr:hypothetical protein [Microscillaceae bacterium]